MGTRANIIVQRGPEDFAIIYTHWDGYPSHMGVWLDRFYDSNEAALELVANGDLSSLDVRIAPGEGEAHSFDAKAAFCTVFYGRDRGEEGTEARTFSTLEAAMKEADNEYVYVRKAGGNCWLFAEVELAHDESADLRVSQTTPDDLQPLPDFIATNESCIEEVARLDEAGVTTTWRDAGCPHYVSHGTYGPTRYAARLNADGSIPETFDFGDDIGVKPVSVCPAPPLTTFSVTSNPAPAKPQSYTGWA